MIGRRKKEKKEALPRKTRPPGDTEDGRPDEDLSRAVQKTETLVLKFLHTHFAPDEIYILRGTTVAMKCGPFASPLLYKEVIEGTVGMLIDKTACVDVKLKQVRRAERALTAV